MNAPLMILSKTFAMNSLSPISGKMGVFIRLAGNLFPLTYFIPIARGIISKGIGIEFLWGQLVAMLIYGTVIMVAATRAFRRGLE